jgi:hypothetical protein
MVGSSSSAGHLPVCLLHERRGPGSTPWPRFSPVFYGEPMDGIAAGVPIAEHAVDILHDRATAPDVER